jgi:hypothetical protein
VTVKRKSNSSQTGISLNDCSLPFSNRIVVQIGLIGCLGKGDPLMFRHYERLKLETSRKQPPTIEELRMVAGLPSLDAYDATILKANLNSKFGGVRFLS